MRTVHWVRYTGYMGTVHWAWVHGYGTGTVRVRYGYGTGTVRVRYRYGTGTVRVRCGYGAGMVGVRYVGMVRGYGTWVRYMGHLRGCGARVHVIKLAPAKCSSTDIVDGLGWVGKGSAHYLGHS